MKKALRFLVLSLTLFVGMFSSNAQAQYAKTIIGYPVFDMVVDKPYFSPSQLWFVIFQGDGNLVVYRIGAATNVVLWSSSTFGAKRAVLQDDGNFVIYNSLNPLPANAMFKTGGGQPGGTVRPQIALGDAGSFEVTNTSGIVWRTPAEGRPDPNPQPPCTGVRQYPICYSPGKVAQLNGTVLACSASDAARQASEVGASYGRCPGT